MSWEEGEEREREVHLGKLGNLLFLAELLPAEALIPAACAMHLLHLLESLKKINQGSKKKMLLLLLMTMMMMVVTENQKAKP